MSKKRKRAEGSIEERVKDRKYLIRWSTKDADGKTVRHNKIVNGDSIEAEAELGRMLRPVAEAMERTFADYAENEWAQYVRDKWKDSTRATQGSFVTKHIRPYFDAMILSKITATDVANFQRSLDEVKHLSKKTRRNVHAVLTTMLKYAAATLELIPKSPVKPGIAPKKEDHEKSALSPEQGWALWDALAGPKTIRRRAFYGVLLFTGIRTSEALGLRWEDIDFAGRQLTVRRAIVRGEVTTPKTKASLRTRPLSPELYTALLNHKSMATVYRAPTDYVFCSSSGRPANADDLRAGLQAVLREKLGVHLPPREDGLHLLRHTSGSLVYRATGSVKETQAWLGHSSARITMDVYTHLMDKNQQATADAVFTRPEVPAVAPERTN